MAGKKTMKKPTRPSAEAIKARAESIANLKMEVAKAQVALDERNDAIEELTGVLVREWHYHRLRAQELHVELKRRGVPVPGSNA